MGSTAAATTPVRLYVNNWTGTRTLVADRFNEESRTENPGRGEKPGTVRYPRDPLEGSAA